MYTCGLHVHICVLCVCIFVCAVCLCISVCVCVCDGLNVFLTVDSGLKNLNLLS